MRAYVPDVREAVPPARPRALATTQPYAASWLVQCGQRVAPMSIVDLQNWHAFVVGAPLGGSLTKILLMRQATKPMMKKLITAFTRWPSAKLNFHTCSTYVAHSPL